MVGTCATYGRASFRTRTRSKTGGMALLRLRAIWPMSLVFTTLLATFGSGVRTGFRRRFIGMPGELPEIIRRAPAAGRRG